MQLLMDDQHCCACAKGGISKFHGRGAASASELAAEAEMMCAIRRAP